MTSATSSKSTFPPPHHSNNEPLSDHENSQNSLPRARNSSEFQNLISATATELTTKARKSRRPLGRSQFSFRQIASQWWLWELLACFGSLLGLIAILTFLKTYDGRSQPQWPSYITVNTVISLLAGLMKAPLLLSTAACISQAKWVHYRATPRPLTDFVVYDNASRGPLGSLSLLWLLKGRQNRYIASLGALLTILAVAIDPTVQQMVKIQTRITNATTAAHLGKAQSYLSYDIGSLTELSNAIFTTEMVGAIYYGMFFGSGDAQGNTLDISPSCPTGNCTFPTFQSLAVCSTCRDVTYAIKRTCPDMTYERSWDEPTTTVNEQLYCELSLPNGLKVNNTCVPDTSGPFASVGDPPPLAQLKIGSTILNFSRILAEVYDPQGNEIRKQRADQCSLYWCVNTYQSRVRNGRTDENITHSWHSNTTIYSGDPQVPNDWRLDLVPPTTSEQHSNNPTFTVAYLATSGLSHWLAGRTTTSNSKALFIENGAQSWRQDDSSNSSSSSPDMLKVLRDSDATTLFANIAKSMTRNIRSVNASQQTMASDKSIGPVSGVGPVNGTAQELQVYVSVHWPWLTLSALLVAAAIILLALTVADTVRRDVSSWKASPLPVLLQILQETKSQHTSEPVRGIADMEELASNIFVELRDTREGGLEMAEHRNLYK